MGKERIIWIDVLKGALILLVVLGHAIQTELGPDCEESHLWNLIYSFHMPAFMAVSGWLFYKTPSALTPSSYKKRGGVCEILYKKSLPNIVALSHMVYIGIPL